MSACGGVGAGTHSDAAPAQRWVVGRGRRWRIGGGGAACALDTGRWVDVLFGIGDHGNQIKNQEPFVVWRDKLIWM